MSSEGVFVVRKRVCRRVACLSSGDAFVVGRRGRCSKKRRDEHDAVSNGPRSTAKAGQGENLKR